MPKTSPMDADTFWETLERSADSWVPSELQNLLAYYLRNDLALSDQSPRAIIQAYRAWYESPTNALDDTLPAHARRQAPAKELYELVMVFKTCQQFKSATRK